MGTGAGTVFLATHAGITGRSLEMIETASISQSTSLVVLTQNHHISGEVTG